VPSRVATRCCGGEEEAERMEEALAGGVLRRLPIRRLVCADEDEGRRRIGDYFFNTILQQFLSRWAKTINRGGHHNRLSTKVTVNGVFSEAVGSSPR
jgi:hypothetical protein